MELFKRMGVGWRARRGRKAPRGALRALWAAAVLLCAAPLTAASTDSIRLGVMPTDIWPPLAVTDFAVTPNTEGSVLLNWTAPIEDGGISVPKTDPVAGYTIRYATFSASALLDDTTAWFGAATFNSTFVGAANPGASEPTKAIAGLEPGATLYFMLRSTDAAGNISPLTPTVTAQVPDAVPSAPTSLTALVTESSATLSWTAPAPDPGDLDFYRVYLNTATPAAWFTTATVSVPTLTRGFNPLTPGATYQFKVTVVDKGQPNYLGDALESSDSNILTVRILPNAPTGFTFVTVTTESITWQWTDNSGIETGFNIYASTGGLVGSAAASPGTGGVVQWTETGLTPGAQYQRHVVAVDNGESSPSNSSSRYTLANAPSGLTASTATASSISLLWNANGNASGTQYLLERATSPTGPFSLDKTVTVSSATDTGLAELSTYTYRLYARNGDNVDTSSVTLTASTLLVAPGAIYDLTATPNFITHDVVLNWTAPGDDGYSGDITGGAYDIRWSTNPISSDADFNAIPTTAQYSKTISTNAVAGSLQGTKLNSLNFNGLVYFAVKTRDEFPTNFSNLSNIAVTTVTLPYAPPKPPRHMRGQRTSSTQFLLQWDSPTYRTDGQPIIPGELEFYKILRSPTLLGATNQTVLQSASTTTAYTDAIGANQLAFYRIRAVNLAGLESADSDWVDSGCNTYVFADDNISFVKIPCQQIQSIYDGNLEVVATRRPDQEGGRTYKAIDLDVRDADTGDIRRNYVFDQPVQMTFAYLVDGSGKVVSGAPAVISVPMPTASEAKNAFSIYWFNGAQWIKLGASVDTSKQNADVQVRQTGSYQLRLVQSADVQQNSVFPRTITPNGDGINDIVFFFFENRTGLPVHGEIYDLRSQKVADLQEGNLVAGDNTVMTWDGKDGSGAVVPGGAYLYKIEIGERVFTGTIAVAR